MTKYMKKFSVDANNDSLDIGDFAALEAKA